MQFPQSSNTSNSHKMACSHHFISFSVFGVSISINCLFVRAQTQFILLTLTSYDVGVKRYFDPSDTELLRALHSRNSKNIRNPLIFLQKMASYSCFWRVPSSKILLQASLHRIYDLLTLVSSYNLSTLLFFEYEAVLLSKNMAISIMMPLFLAIFTVLH